MRPPDTRPSRRGFAILILPAIPSLVSCGGSGGSPAASRGAERAGTWTVTGVEARSREGGQVEVSFQLESRRSEAIAVDLALSEDGGNSFRPATLSPAVLPATAAARLHTLTWNAAADLSAPNQHDLAVRVTPFHPRTGTRGQGAESPIFGMGPNTPPRVTAVRAPPGKVGGVAAFEIDTLDAEGDHSALEAEVALPDGRVKPATLAGAGTRRAASPRELLWDAAADLPDAAIHGARLRVRARDTEAGEFLETGPLEVMTIRPALEALTIEGIDEEMNGSIPFLNASGEDEPFLLLLPPHGFTIQLRAAPGDGGMEISPESLSVTISYPAGSAGSADTDAPREIGPQFSPGTGGESSWHVPASMALEPGTRTVTARIADTLGNVSLPRSLTFRIEDGESGPAPFDRVDHWLLDFTRDHFTIRSSIEDGRVAIEAVPGKNGIADHTEDLAALGLQRLDAPPGSTDAALSEKVLEWTRETVRGYLYAHYGKGPLGEESPDSVPIQLHLTPPAALLSRMAFGGDDPLPGFTIGRAEFDRKNRKRNDDSAPDLGIFTTNVVQFHINSSFLFRARFDPFIPGRGVPLGSDPRDILALGSTSGERSERLDQLVEAVDAWARMLALVAAHEIGHSVGLVANDAPPRGLFGGVSSAAFAGPFTNPYHLDAPGNDIMSAALGFSDSLLDGPAAPRFNALHLAYLLGRVRLQ